jgi:hypothetical protein
MCRSKNKSRRHDVVGVGHNVAGFDMDTNIIDYEDASFICPIYQNIKRVTKKNRLKKFPKQCNERLIYKEK